MNPKAGRPGAQGPGPNVPRRPVSRSNVSETPQLNEATQMTKSNVLPFQPGKRKNGEVLDAKKAANQRYRWYENISEDGLEY
jgi:hypothetical protein